MKVDLFDFELPERLIAQVPLQERDASRLMVLDKETGDITHSTFKHIIDFCSRRLHCAKRYEGSAGALVRSERRDGRKG